MFWQNRTSLPQAKRQNAFLRQHGNQLGCCPSPDPASMARNLPLLLAVRFPATRFHQVLLEASLGWFIDVCSHMQPPRLDLGQSFASGCCRGEPGGGCLLIHVITTEDDSVILWYIAVLLRVKEVSYSPASGPCLLPLMAQDVFAGLVSWNGGSAAAEALPFAAPCHRTGFGVWLAP